jgi:hypothetical protein
MSYKYVQLLSKKYDNLAIPSRPLCIYLNERKQMNVYYSDVYKDFVLRITTKDSKSILLDRQDFSELKKNLEIINKKFECMSNKFGDTHQRELQLDQRAAAKQISLCN